MKSSTSYRGGHRVICKGLREAAGAVAAMKSISHLQAFTLALFRVLHSGMVKPMLPPDGGGRAAPPPGFVLFYDFQIGGIPPCRFHYHFKFFRV